MNDGFLDFEGLTQVSAEIKTRVKSVDSLPATATDGAVYLYVGEDTENYTKGHTYQYQTNSWTDITSPTSTFNESDFNTTGSEVSLVPERRIFKGTLSDWNNLSLTEKKSYSYFARTDDDSSEGDIVKSVFNLIFPIGRQYPQFPGEPSPNEMWGEFSTWTEVDYSGAFFRASGGNAQSFDNQTSPQSDTIKQTSVFVSGGSHDHGGRTGGNHSNVHCHGWSHAYQHGGDGFCWDEDYSQHDNVSNNLVILDDHSHTISSSGTLSMTGTIGNGNAETRPTNYTFKVWKRIA